MKKLIFTLFIFITLPNAQTLEGWKFCINPGHGGHDSNDRYVQATGFWESESNLTKGLKLREILEAFGAEIVMTRTRNRTQDDIALSQVVAIANSNNVDHMHSIHSNGWNGQSNYTLMLFQGGDNAPTYPAAKVMGQIMGTKIYQTHRTTANYNRGDFDFYGTGQPYLGVFRNLNMPGTLSEGSFHDYIPESWRLRSEAYCHSESWAMARSFLEFTETEPLPFGFIAGLVRNQQKTVSWYYRPGSNDRYQPVNGLEIFIPELNRSFRGDFLNNGFFLIDSVPAGDYTIIYNAEGFNPDTSTITVTNDAPVFADKFLTKIDGLPTIPQNPRLIASASQIHILFEAVEGADGYILYYGPEPHVYSDTLSSETNEFTISNWPELSPFYCYLRAYNANGLSPRVNTALYAAATENNGKIALFVDGFDRNSYFNNSYDYVKKYAPELTNRGYGFSFAKNEAIINGDVNLTDYQTLIWMSGNESTVDETFSAVEQEKVADFLKGGGYMMVSGAEIGWDLGRENSSSNADIAFYTDYLRAIYRNDAPGSLANYFYEVEDFGESIFDGIANFWIDDGSKGTYNVGYADGISPVESAHAGLKFTGVAYQRATCAIHYRGLFPGGSEPGKLVYFTFPFETVYPDSARQELMNRVMSYFEDPETGMENIALSADAFQLLPAYPNPFNATVSIPFYLPHSAEISLKIFDLNGRLVQELISSQNYKAGHQQIQWNSLNRKALPVSSGVYLIQLNSKTQRRFQKISLMK